MQQPVRVEQCSAWFNDSFSLRGINWQLEPGQCWVILGQNGAGKSALGALLAGAGEIRQGHIEGLPARVELVSLERQAALINAERAKDDSDITDVVFTGTPVHELLAEQCRDVELQDRLVQLFRLAPLLERGFRQLSTGETRKLLLIRALVSEPDLLVLDEPYEGLDVQAAEALALYLEERASTTPLVLILNRVDEIPNFATHLALLQGGELVQQVATSDQGARQQLLQLLHLQTSDLTIPPPDPGTPVPVLNAAEPLVRIKQGRVAYGAANGAEKVVFEHLDWCIEPGQHWQLSGPNGSGKTCLLNLINGDHPQCYNNDIFVFGYQRGRGESIWEIKQHIGYVSSSLQWEYRVSISVQNVLLSGFYDSIGLYQTATDSQRSIVRQWLKVLGMGQRSDAPFQQLSFGDQRLVLIARAMVKHPHLLILDEPCLGLDDMNRQLVLALVSRLCSETSTTVIYVNHHAADVIQGIDHYLALAGDTAEPSSAALAP
jgi:molybdate transport system ATP-binding protein